MASLTNLLTRRSNRKKIAIAIVVVFCVMEIFAWYADHNSSVTYTAWKKISYNKTLQASQSYYRSHTVSDIDELFLQHILWPRQVYVSGDVQNLFERLFDHDSIAHDVYFTRQAQSQDEIMFLIKSFPQKLNNRFYDIPQKYRSSLEDPSDDIILKALYCDVTGYDELDYKILMTLRDHDGWYFDTHNLLGLLLLQENNCYDQDVIAIDKENVVADIIAAQQTDQIFSDLYAESIVFLYWAGEGDVVVKDWIDTIKDGQNTDGGWADRGQTQSDPHATGLAAIAVKYFIAGKNTQTFYH